MRHGQCQGAARQLQAIRDRRLAGRIDEPGERPKRAARTDHGVDAAPLWSRATLARTGSGAAIRATAIKEAPITEPLVVRRETHIAAPPGTVSAFLTNPEKILSWMGGRRRPRCSREDSNLLKGVGSRVARGAFREVVPVHRLAYSFGWTGMRRCRRDRAWSRST